MSEWKECKLGDAIILQRGHDLPKSKMIDGSVPVAGSNGIIGYHNKYTTLAPGVTIGRSGKLGNSYFYKEKFWAHNTTLYVKDFKGNNELFIYYFLKTFDFKQFNVGSAVPTLNRNHIHPLEILLPPLPEQKAIASVLSSLDDKIDLLHQQNKTLEAMAETLFRQWFVEEAEEDWEVRKLGDYIEIKHGYAFKGKNIITEKTNQILVTPGNFKIGGGFKTEKMKYYIGVNYPKDYIFSSNDLIVTMTDLSKDGDTLGFPALIPEHNQSVLYLHNQRVGKINFKKNISRYFVYYLMKTDDYRWFILGGASGTSVRHTSPSAICSYTFQVPPMTILLKFDKILEELISKVHKNQKQIHTLEKLRDTILPKLMSGEVRVSI